MIRHHGTSVFKNMPEPFEATRYHSLLVKRATLPSCLEITATCSDDESEIMGLRHKELPIHGVQFHPESILTQDGKKLLRNFLEM
jgi:anthranilate synthase/aminodeoxychorismate synthase-like glutamine amidotransferase